MGIRKHIPLLILALVLATGAGKVIAQGLSGCSFGNNALPGYYVSSTGSDTDTGTSPAHAWLTVTRANCGPTGIVSGNSCTLITHYPANASIFFQGGATFNGCGYWKGYDGYPGGGTWGPNVGNAANGGLTLTSYGGGLATIKSTCSGMFVAAEFLDGVANFTLSNLNIQGGTNNDPIGTYHFYNPNIPTIQSTQPATYTFGVTFTPQAAGNVSGIEFYKWSGDASTTRILGLWTGGTEVASCTTTSEPASGWVSCNLSSAYTTTVGTAYIASYTVTAGNPGAGCPGGCTPNSTPLINVTSCYNAGTNVLPGNCFTPPLSYTVGPIFNSTAAYSAPLTNIGIEITNNCGVSCTASVITVQNSIVQNFAAVQQVNCEICIHGDSLPTAINGPLDKVSIINNTIGGTGGPTSPDVNGITGYGFGLNITNTLIAGNTISNLGGYQGSNGFAVGIGPGGWSVAKVQYNIIHDIGGNSGSNCGGPGAIVSFQATAVIIQFNEVYKVQPVPNTFPPPGGGCDWVAYDLDGGTQNSIVQYNYSHNNAGAAWLAFTVDISGIQWGNNIYRFNVSENDDFLNTSNGIFAFGAPTEKNLQFYNNTMYSTTSLATGSSPITCIFQGFVGGAFAAGSTVNNNICYNTGTYQFGGTTYFKTEDIISGITIANNLYFGGTGSVAWNYNNTGYSTLAAFQTACSCDAGSTSTIDPKLTNPGGGGTCSWTPALSNGPQPCPSAYKLQSGSPAAALGAHLLTCPTGGNSTKLGLYDYYLDTIVGICGS